MTLKENIKDLYEGASARSDRFRYMLLIGDLVTIFFLIVSTFFYGYAIVEWFDVLFGFYIMADLLARFWIDDLKSRFMLRPLNIIDLIVVLSFMMPMAGGNFAFLRSLRILRLLRSVRLLERLRLDFKPFAKREDLIISATHMGVFMFIMTELVFATQVNRNPAINNFIDALYFTITSLTTTGYGDMTLKGADGKLLSIVIMICGVSLFLRLLKSIFRPAKIRFECTDCGLFMHENDAVCCKHCGKVLNIPSDGDA